MIEVFVRVSMIVRVWIMRVVFVRVMLVRVMLVRVMLVRVVPVIMLLLKRRRGCKLLDQKTPTLSEHYLGN